MATPPDETEASPPTDSPGVAQSGPVAWTPEMVAAAGTQLNALVDKVVKAIEAWHKREVKAEIAQGSRELKLVFGLLGFAGVVVAVAGYLAWRGIVSGDGFMFLAGTLVGSLIVLVQRLLTLQRGAGTVDED